MVLVALDQTNPVGLVFTVFDECAVDVVGFDCDDDCAGAADGVELFQADFSCVWFVVPLLIGVGPGFAHQK